jgi:Flp pilus assembly protein TadD
VTSHNEPRDDITDELTGPGGDVVDWYRRAVDLLDSRNDAAAAVLLERALQAEPASPALQEAMGRARFGSRQYAESADLFGSLVERDPTDHYARYGLGLALSRLGRQEDALEHLAVAVAMRPSRGEYDDALRQARATVDARRAAGT